MSQGKGSKVDFLIAFLRGQFVEQFVFGLRQRGVRAFEYARLGFRLCQSPLRQELAATSAGEKRCKTCVVGYELARSAQGAGFMRETLLTAFSYGFNEMKVNRISADIHPLNEPSIRLLRALGFVEEGRARQAGYWGGEYHDLVQFGLLRQEYEQSLETIHVPT